MNHGRVIRCDTPSALKHGLEEHVFLLKSEDHRRTVDLLEKQPGVLTVQPAGADLHLFIDQGVTSPEKLASVTPFSFRPIVPSLEDVFIALSRRGDRAA
jgi:hypothetical protein